MIDCTSLPGGRQMSNDDAPVTLPARPQNRLLSSVRLVEQSMVNLDCRLYKGDVYIKPKDAVSTYVYFKPIEGFLEQLTSNKKLAEQLIGNIPSICSILQSANCHVIP